METGEAQVGLELGTGGTQHPCADSLHAGRDLIEQSGLADPSVTQYQQRASSGGGPLDERPDPGEVLVPSDQLHARVLLAGASTKPPVRAGGATMPKPRAARRATTLRPPHCRWTPAHSSRPTTRGATRETFVDSICPRTTLVKDAGAA
jgi:hypothetical protein